MTGPIGSFFSTIFLQFWNKKFFTLIISRGLWVWYIYWANAWYSKQQSPSKFRKVTKKKKVLDWNTC